MKLIINDAKLYETFSDFSKLTKEHGLSFAKILYRRIKELMSYDSVEDLFSSNLGSPHFLKGEFNKYISISLIKNQRLILDTSLISDDKNVVMKSKEIYIKGVVDYHGTKNEWIMC